MNLLSIVNYEAEYDGVGKTIQKWNQAEFIIDGIALSEYFSFKVNRPWFGATFMELDNAAWTNELNMFLGKTEANNQFNSNRFVLYRCHCGCDYCGVISCVIEKKHDVVYWKDIYFETDDTEVEGNVISQYTFNYTDYVKCITEFIRKSSK